MRPRALALIFVSLLLAIILVACDAKGLPTSQTSPTSITEAQATATSPAVAEGSTDTPLPPRPTATAEASSVAIATPAGTAEVELTVSPNPQSTTVTNPQIEAQLLQVETDTVAIRGLTPKRDVPETFITKDQMRADLTKEFEKNYSREEARRDALYLWLLRLLDSRTMDLYQLQIDLHSEQVIGYYDPDAKALFVLGSDKSLDPSSRTTLAHEFTHSLQDEYFDLNKLLPDKSKDFDGQTGVLALVEGDATATEFVYAMKHLTPLELQQWLSGGSDSSSSQVFNNAPRYIRESLIFPYTQGYQFVSKLIEAGGFKKVDDAFRDPPKSTEQIMHPEKYMNTPRDEPIPVTIPPLTSTLGTGWTKGEGGSLGEFDLDIMLKDNGITDRQADQAAAGWGGAWFDLYQNGDDGLVAMDTRWDTANDAKEFDQAMRDSLSSYTKDGDFWTKDGRYFAIVNGPTRVLVVASTNRKALESSLGALK